MVWKLQTEVTVCGGTGESCDEPAGRDETTIRWGALGRLWQGTGTEKEPREPPAGEMGECSAWPSAWCC